ncbi:McrC family protein [Actinopolymorpha cephalotaxi]|nr:McrC family protein [Actinopolymorpha cephalotaxi]NYH84002.1 5-methylcytosine-specific restriction enzyme subunit McrC [Actinopolymorpha cephalotaxi]
MVTATPEAAGWRVTAQHVVGVMRRGDLVVRVAPKVGAVQVLTLLARAEAAANLTIDPEQVHVVDDADLSVVLARLFTAEAAHAMAAGPLRGYRTEDQTLPVLRGRVRLREQHLRRFGQVSPLEVTVDEWTVDTAENRLIRSAALALLQLPGLGDEAETDLRRLDRMLVDAQPLVPGEVPPAWTATRLNARLHSLLALSEIVLRFAGVEDRLGETPIYGFRLNMATLFERLVARLFEETDPAWSAQETMPLDEGGTLAIRPDLLRQGAGGACAVADTKYKLLDDAGKVSNPDVYQLVTYCARLGLSTGHLIYADGGDEPVPYEILGTGVTVAVHRLDLTQPLPRLEAQVRTLASVLTGEGRKVRIARQ